MKSTLMKILIGIKRIILKCYFIIMYYVWNGLYKYLQYSVHLYMLLLIYLNKYLHVLSDHIQFSFSVIHIRKVKRLTETNYELRDDLLEPNAPILKYVCKI
jgi:hypothetical protein